MDDILEKDKAGHTQELTDHLNSIDDTGNIKFMHEEEADWYIAFSDMKIQQRRWQHKNKGLQKTHTQINIYFERQNIRQHINYQ